MSFSQTILNDLRRIDEENNDEVTQFQEYKIEIETFDWLPGKRAGSQLLWIPDEQHLYYINSYSKRNNETACTCAEPKCRARVYVREDGTVFKKSKSIHIHHGTHFDKMKLNQCSNQLKKLASSSKASQGPADIYKEVLKQYVQNFIKLFLFSST